jgi:prepilin-type N-terminal cleavage/methylation domain-containing protein
MLAMMRRRGFTLVEALLAVVLLAIVGQSILRLLTISQRLFRAQSERAALQAAVRAGASLIPAELRELGPGDIISMAPDAIVYRAMRSTAVACAVTAGAVVLPRELVYGYRSASPGRDSLLLFVEHDPSRSADDSWEALPVTAPPGTGACPDGRTAVVIPTAVPAATLGSVILDAPVRSFEVVQLRLYQSAGQYWLGSQSLSGGESQVQPLLGPLAPDGLRLRFLDAGGLPTAAPAEVRLVSLTVRGVTDGAIATGYTTGPAVVAESLAADIELRNAQ